MKRLTTILTCVLLLVCFSNISYSEDDACDNVPSLVLARLQETKLQDIFEHYNDSTYLLTNYGRTFLSPNQDVYCFNIENSRGMALVVSNGLVFEKKDDLDVQIEGLKLKSAIQEPVLRVIHSGDEGTIQLHALSVEEGGIALEAKVDNGVPVVLPEDAIELDSTTIVGINKGNNCLTVSAPGTILDDVEVSNCAEGIRIEADNVQIVNSVVKSNKIGIHVTNGFQGTNINRTLNYDNTDGDSDTLSRMDALLLDQGIISDLSFFEMIEEEPVFFEPEEDLVSYQGGFARVLLPEMHGKAGRVELYLAKPDECGVGGSPITGQPCKLIDNMPIEITPEKLAQEGGVQFSLEQKYMEKQIVAIYTTPEEGSTAISQKFTLLDDGSGGLGVVAFVQTPYDIPTPGGGVDDVEVAAGGTDEIEVGGSGMDSGGSNPIGAGPAAKCSLVPNAQRGLLGGFGTLWWIFAALAALGTTRLCRARIRHN